MTSTPTTEVPQTSAQQAMRWHGLVLVGALLAVVPLVHVVWHGMLGHDEPLLRTRSQVDAPAATVANVMDGSWMVAKEKELREASPVSWYLRGAWNDLRYRVGVPESAQVHFGKDEWFFIKESVHPDRAAFERARPNRLRFLAEVRDLVRKSGAELFVFVNPDKARIYPDFCYPDGVLPPAKQGNYAAILADLATLGIPTADFASAIAAARAADPHPATPEGELYYRRDTHWRPQGALVAGAVAAAAIEARVGDRLRPRVEMRLPGKDTARVVCDLVSNMGIHTVEYPERLATTAPASFLAESLAEVKEYYALEWKSEQGFLRMDGEYADAEVLLIGASFAKDNGAVALSYSLGRPLRTSIRFGATGLASLQAALPELRAGTKAKVVVWDIVERGFFSAEWQDPKL
jgi:hypothetical protein